MAKRIKPRINSYCTYCKEEGREKVRAEWRIPYNYAHRACDEHKSRLPEPTPDDHITEGDRQSWMRV